jgi:uncharacterized protein
VRLEVLAIRRYPVKSMGGEALGAAPFDHRGMVGDRWFAVEDGEGRFASGKNTRRFRRHDQVFDYYARTDTSKVTVTGPTGSWKVGDPALDRALCSAMGTPVRVTPEADVPHQDAGPVSLVGSATLRWCAKRWGVDPDPRRLRTNILFQSEEPFVEETWVGRTIQVGSALLGVVGRAERCRMIDIAQDGVAPADRWLKPLAAEREIRLAVYAEVTRPGTVTVGDTIQVA